MKSFINSLYSLPKTLPVAAAAAALIATVVAPSTLSLVGAGAAIAQEAEKPKIKAKTRKVPAMSVGVHKKIQKAQEMMDEKDIPGAEKMLASVLDSTKPNDYERAVTWQMRAMITFELDDTPGTIRAYEQILTYADSIPEALEMSILFNLGQLYYTLENYTDALRYVNLWEDRTTLVSVNQLVFIAQLHYVMGDFNKVLEYVYRAISDAEAVDTVEVKENWYGLALSAHWEMNEYDKVRDILEILIVNWPKPVYWTQLAGVYGELGEEEASFSLSEAAYKQGFLDDKDIQLVNMAQIQIARQAPIKAVWVMEKALTEERIEASADNNKLLGQAYMMSNEFEKAIEPLSKSAAQDDDADLWFQIGQVLMQLDRHTDAINAFDKAIIGFQAMTKKADVTKARPKILASHMQKGTALTELTRFKEAAAAFNSAKKVAKDKRERKMVSQWTNYMKTEKAREDTLHGRS